MVRNASDPVYIKLLLKDVFFYKKELKQQKNLLLIGVHLLVRLQIVANIVLFDPLLDVLSRQQHGRFWRKNC